MIVRINADPLKLVFEREKHAMTLARSAGLPIPRVLHRRRPAPVHGAGARQRNRAAHAYDRIDTVRQMGEITARSTDPVALVWALGSRRKAECALPRRHSWGAHLEGDLRIRAHRGYGAANVSAGQRRKMPILLHMFTWRRNPVLHHGDMRLKNIIVDQHGSIWRCCDWEHCTASVPALWDLSVALHDLTIDEKQAFLQGYGYRPRELTKSIGYMRLLNALNYAPRIAEMAERGERPD